MQIEASQAVQKYTEEHECEVDAETILAIFIDNFGPSKNKIEINDYEISNHQGDESIAVTIAIDDTTHHIKGAGSGALDAFCNGLNQYLDTDIDIKKYEQSSAGKHKNAQAIAMISMTIDSEKYTCYHSDPDTIKASLSALLIGTAKYLESKKHL